MAVGWWEVYCGSMWFPMRWFSSVLVLACCFVSERALLGASIRFNQIQVIGTHNSYHIAPEPAMMALIEQRGKGLAASIDYTHRPLWEQFSILGIRQIELDVFADPEGGHYANPAGRKLVELANLGPLEAHDPKGRLNTPGLKVLHVTDFDYRTRVYTFVDALQEIRSWSDENPRHIPVTVLVEVKEASKTPGLTPPIPFDATQLDEIDREIRSVFSAERLITPDWVRGDRSTLREAVLEDGWPLLDEVRGRVLFALDNGGSIRDHYLAGHPSLEGRVLFVSVVADHPAAAFMKINDPIQDGDRIKAAVRSGFIVRTRADSPTRHARENDTSQRERALSSGAQFVSTDFPEPEMRYSSYQVGFEGNRVARPNPLFEALETTAVPSVREWIHLSGAKRKELWQNPFSWGRVQFVDDEIRLDSERNFMVALNNDYADFVLELEAIVPSGNSGIFFRCQEGEKKLLGYQAEIDLSERQYSGGLYDNTGRGFLVPKKDDKAALAAFKERQKGSMREGEWNRYRIECFGNRIRVAINDHWITDIEDSAHRQGLIGLQHHGGEATYRFRNIRLLDLGGTTKP